MNIDRKILYISSYAIFALLLFVLFIPTDYSAWFCAVLLMASTALSLMLIKKRAVYSYNKRQVTALLCLVGFLFVVLFYMSGIIFGFAYSPYPFSLKSLLVRILPNAVAIMASEILRAVLLAQNSRQATVLSFVICVIGEVLLLSSIPQIRSFYTFMDIVALTLLPAIVSNLLYTYLSRRYGIFPNLGYRMLVGLFSYFIPVVSAMPDAFYSLVKLFVPILIYFFISGLYEKKRRYALRKKGIGAVVSSIIVVGIAVAYVMLISCQFTFGLLVIATPSMSGEINQGDAVIYKEYENDRSIEVGQILVFEKDNSTIVHRVVDIEIINGQARYFTKGDANEDEDLGYITDANIVGVVEAKVSLIGYPTLWLRSLFKK